MVCRVPYCGHPLQHASKDRTFSGLRIGSRCNLSGSFPKRRARESSGCLGMTAIPRIERGTDPVMMRASDGDGPAMMTNAAATATLRQHAAAATTAQKV